MSATKKPKNAQQGAKGLVFDTLAQAAAHLGISKPDLKRFKAEGAPGFRGSRVYVEELLPWLEKRGDKLTGDDDGGEEESKDKLERRKLSLQCERIRHQIDVEKKLYYLKAEVDAEVRAVSERQKNALLTIFRNELAPQLQLRPDQIPLLEEHALKICKIHRDGLNKYFSQ